MAIRDSDIYPLSGGASATIRSFPFISAANRDIPGNGQDIGYWLGTKGNTTQFYNPAMSRQVDGYAGISPEILAYSDFNAPVAMSLTTNRCNYQPFSRNNAAAYIFYTTLNASPAQLAWFFMQGRSAKISRYMFLSGASTYSFNAYQRAWTLQAANSPWTNWVDIDNVTGQTQTGNNTIYTSAPLANNTFYSAYRLLIEDSSTTTQRVVLPFWFWGDLSSPSTLSY